MSLVFYFAPMSSSMTPHMALEELAVFSTEVNILGVYPAHPQRIAAGKEERGEA